MLDRIKALIRNKNFYLIALGFVLVTGIFLRTYKFSAWLQFSPDQARDLNLIENTLSGKILLPLLGPQAGNTNLNMGPLYYHWQYLSALIFGASPESMAYPDLLFSILAIPLFFLLTRKFFDKKTSLAIAALFAVSFFAIVNSRFASNPNSIPFFVFLFLYSILELASEKKSNKFFWAATTGIATGVGIQLHTLLIFIMLAVLGITCLYLLLKKILNWKSAITIIIFFLLINTGQIIGEVQNGWINWHSLVVGVNSKTKDSSITKNIRLVFSCQIQANAHIISSVENLEECGTIYKIGKQISKAESPGRTQKVALLIIRFISVFVFSLGGYFLLGYFLKKEKNAEKKRFLQLVALYSVVSFLVLIPVVTEISVRYFIILIFVPFILFGLWAKFLLEKLKNSGMIAIGAFFLILTAMNFSAIISAGSLYMHGLASNSQDSILGEVKQMNDYIILNLDGAAKFNLIGQREYLHRFGKPLAYLAKKSGKEMVKSQTDKNLDSSIPTFYIGKSDSKEDKNILEIKKHKVSHAKKFGNIRIYLIKN